MLKIPQTSKESMKKNFVIIQMSIFHKVSIAREMVQSIKCLICKYKDLSLIPSTHKKKPGVVVSM